LARLRTLTIHPGRHTFISHALAGGSTLAEKRVAARHSNVAIASGYLHVVVDEDDGVGELSASSRNRYKQALRNHCMAATHI
jgi:integrase